MVKGLVIPILEKYENILIENLHNLYVNLKCTLPIELWQIDNEISRTARKYLNKLN